MKKIDKIKENGQKYAEECNKIYKNIRFARLETKELSTDRLTLLFGIFSAALFLALAYLILTAVEKAQKGKFDMADNAFGLILVSLLLGGAVLGFVRSYKYDREERNEILTRYYIYDGENKYRVTLSGGAEHEKKFIGGLTCFNKEAELCITGDGARPGEDPKRFGTALEFTGFYGFTPPPPSASKGARAAKGDEYITKTECGDTTLYYLPRRRRVKGEKYPRSVLLQNGTVAKVCSQKVRRSRRRGRGTVTAVTTKITAYSFVNDSSCKLYISARAVGDAQKLNFPLPKSENIVIE
jgi:Tfp pilus assembly major pilin PilA